MKKQLLWGGILLLAVALGLSGYQAAGAPRAIGGFAAIAASGPGQAWVAIPSGSRIEVSLLDEAGVARERFSLPRKSGEQAAHIESMAADGEGRVYLLKTYTGAASGQYEGRQELLIYTPGLLPFGRVKTIRLNESEEEGGEGDAAKPRVGRYLHVFPSTSVVLTGVSEDADELVREAYDLDSLLDSGAAVIKGMRRYPADPYEELYRAVPSGTDIVFLAKTGRLFRSSEGSAQPVRLYPDEGAELSTYVSFLEALAPGAVLVGEQKSGNVLRLSANDGRFSYLLEGNNSLGTLPYTSHDLLSVSVSPASENSWVAQVQNPATGAAELVLCNEGEYTLHRAVQSGLGAALLAFLWRALLYFAAMVLAVAAAVGLFRVVVGSRLLVVKLIVASLPLLVLALAFFGVYSYRSFQSSLLSTYETKAADQGNLLRALFSSASFDQITAPGLHGSTEHLYLQAQMNTRDVYTSSAYFVDGALYTGVSGEYPTLFPFGIRQSASAWALYRRAALTGAQQAGVVSDKLGERLVCVTPVGSSSGNTVFLLETGIFREEINRQTGGYLRGYLVASALCILAACALLLASFIRILRPLGGIVEGLDAFSKGNRTVRLALADKANDELADIARVFNKMAKDIDVQLYNLKAMGDTYYRFVPQQVFRLLGRENLADVDLESAVEGKYCVLVANLYSRQPKVDFESARERINCFFAIVHRAAGENGATLLSDSAGLGDLRLLCPDGNAAARAAMEAIARIDEHNAKCDIAQRLSVSFFLHHTVLGFGICGDGERYVPAMISSELDEILALCEEFRRFSSRLIVTEAAYKTLDASGYFHRFIGFVSGADEATTGLYDFYDSSSPGTIRLLNETLGAFNKGMELYSQKRFYDAKNMFAIVLRENQYDNVARHYVFQCERKL